MRTARGGKDDDWLEARIEGKLDKLEKHIKIDITPARDPPWIGEDRVDIRSDGYATFLDRDDYSLSPVMIVAAVRILYKKGFRGRFKFILKKNNLSIHPYDAYRETSKEFEWTLKKEIILSNRRNNFNKRNFEIESFYRKYEEKSYISKRKPIAMRILINKRKTIEFGKALKDGYYQYFEFYNENIRKKMPEYKYLTPRYKDPKSAYAYFFGCMMDQMGVSGKITWEAMGKLERLDPNIFDIEYLLNKYPEKYDCKERSKKLSSCYAKKFLNDYHLSFYLNHVHTMFRSAHFFYKLKKERKINSILDLPEVERYRNAFLLYNDLKNWIYKTSKIPKTLSLAFRIMTESKDGTPEGENRFWKYDNKELKDIPMSIDFWIAYFVFKSGLLELDIDKGIISASDPYLKQAINNLFQKIARISGIPPIFMDPVIWKISGDKCINNFCHNCLFKDIFGYKCSRSTKINSVSQMGSAKRKIYYLFWNREENWQLSDLPKGYKLELKGRRNWR